MKENAATGDQFTTGVANVRSVAPEAEILHADSEVTADCPTITDRRPLVVEGGPTLTHGDSPHGTGLGAARECGAAEIVNPESHAVGSLERILAEYPHLDTMLPAIGYSDAQLEDLSATIRAADPDVVSGTPLDLDWVIDVDVPVVRGRYELAERGVGWPRYSMPESRYCLTETGPRPRRSGVRVPSNESHHPTEEW